MVAIAAASTPARPLGTRFAVAASAAERFRFAHAVFERARLMAGPRPALDAGVQLASERLREARWALVKALGDLMDDCPETAERVWRDANGYVPAAEACCGEAA